MAGQNYHPCLNSWFRVQLTATAVLISRKIYKLRFLLRQGSHFNIRLIKAETSGQLPCYSNNLMPSHPSLNMAGLHQSCSVWRLIICNMHSSKDNQQSCNFFPFHLDSLTNNAEPGEVLVDLNSTWDKLNLYPQCMGQSISQIMNLTTRWDSPDTQPQEIFRLLMSNSVHP